MSIFVSPPFWDRFFNKSNCLTKFISTPTRKLWNFLIPDLTQRPGDRRRKKLPRTQQISCWAWVSLVTNITESWWKLYVFINSLLLYLSSEIMITSCVSDPVNWSTQIPTYIRCCLSGAKARPAGPAIQHFIVFLNHWRIFWPIRFCLAFLLTNYFARYCPITR